MKHQVDVPLPAKPPDEAPPPRHLGIFRSAVTEDNGVSINVGYLSLFWILIVVLNVIPIMVCGAIVEAWNATAHVFPYAELGKGVGMVTGAFAAALGALGLFVKGDRT